MSNLESSDRMTAQLERATKRLAQLQARQSLHEMRLATREKERARRAAVRRQMELGGALVQLGFQGTAQDLAALVRSRNPGAAVTAANAAFPA